MVNNDSCCLAKLLKVIEILQNKAERVEPIEGCDKPFLGPNIECICYNTRPINLYTRAGDLFTVDNSSVFRVEEVNNCCCKLRVLEYDPEACSHVATDSFVTVNLKCMCAVSCLDDLALELC